MSIKKTKTVETTEGKGKKGQPVMTVAQERLCGELVKHASAELNGAELFYKALVKVAGGKAHTTDGIVLAVKHAYLRAGSTEKVASVRVSEARKVVHAIRGKASGFNAGDYKRLQAAASKAPAVTKRGTKVRKGDKAAKPVPPTEHLAAIHAALVGLRQSIDNEAALELVGELFDVAQALADLIVEPEAVEVADKEAA